MNSDVRTELAALYSWPAQFEDFTEPLHDLGTRVDLNRLASVAATIAVNGCVIFAIVSREYTRVGLNWVGAMRRLGLTNFLILAGDEETSVRFAELGIPTILANIDESGFDPNFVSNTGFTAKGLAVSAFKYPVARFLVNAGLNVVMSDADAIWLRDAQPYVRGADVAFQRIVYHPPLITSIWGFAACGGFMAFSNSLASKAFLDHCIAEQKSIFCDQIAVNLALLEQDPVWQCDSPDWTLPEPNSLRDAGPREIAFRKLAAWPISGHLQGGGCRILALQHDAFWRHACVEANWQNMVVCHPNSPKDDLEKIQMLAGLGLMIDPSAQSSREDDQYGHNGAPGVKAAFVQ